MKKLIYAIAMVMLFANCDDEEEIKNNIEFTLTEFNIGITSATAEVILEDIEGYSIENSGVAYATNETPTTDDMTYAAQFEDDRISVNLSDLTADTTYYARAYVNVGDNVLYSSQISFKTKALDKASPTFMTPVFEGMSATKVSVESNAVNNADYGTITEVGFVFMKDGMADVTTMVETEDFSSFSAEFDVMQGESYSVKSYAVNEFGTFYSEVTAIVADWVEEAVPTVSISEPSDITDVTVTFTGEVTDDRDQEILSTGFVYGVSEELLEPQTKGSGSEGFTTQVQNLEGGTVYYVKAYAVNMYGTYYSEIVSFTTDYTEKIKEGDVILGSQEDVDMFVSEKYTAIYGDLIIGVDEDNEGGGPPPFSRGVSDNTNERRHNYKRRTDATRVEYRRAKELGGDISGRMDPNPEPEMPVGSDISDISGLMSISEIKGELTIFNNPSLTSISGLGNLVSSEGYDQGPPGPPNRSGRMEEEMEYGMPSISIVYNEALTSLEGLEGVVNPYEVGIIGNTSLTDFTGLSGLINVDEFYIYDNSSLLNLSGLESLEYIYYLDLEYNNSLINLDGLQGLTSVSDELYIYGNTSLTSLSGLENLVYAEDVYIGNNWSLSNYSALSKLVSESELDLEIYGNLYNPSFEDLIEGDYDMYSQGNVVDETAILWQGPTIPFTKEDGADSSLEANQDRITDEVWLTRGNNGLLYNAYEEMVYRRSEYSPGYVQWANGTIEMGVENLDFTDYLVDGNAENLPGNSFVLYLANENIYIDIKFTSWTSGQNGGGFSYQRSTATPE